MTRQLAIRIPKEQVEGIDAAVAAGRFTSRTAAIREAIDLLLRNERERAIADEYRRAYAAHPQEEWIGDFGLRLFGEAVSREERGREPL